MSQQKIYKKQNLELNCVFQESCKIVRRYNYKFRFFIYDYYQLKS